MTTSNLTDRLCDFYRRLPSLTPAESVREAASFPFHCHDCGLPIHRPSGQSRLDELCDACLNGEANYGFDGDGDQQEDRDR